MGTCTARAGWWRAASRSLIIAGVMNTTINTTTIINRSPYPRPCVMDRQPLLTDVTRILVQRRHVYNPAILALSAHRASILLDPSDDTDAEVDANNNVAVPRAAHISEPGQSIFSAGSGDVITISVHLIGRVTRLPSLPLPSAYTSTLDSSTRAFPIWIQLKNFESLTLYSGTEQVCQDIFRSLRTCTVLQHVEQLAAFHPDPLLLPPRGHLPPSPPVSSGAPGSDYTGKPSCPGAESSGWDVYDPMMEFERQGVWSRTRAWRTTTLNSNYTVCPITCCLLHLPDSMEVLPDISRDVSGTCEDKRYDAAARGQISVQVSTPHSHLPALGTPGHNHPFVTAIGGAPLRPQRSRRKVSRCYFFLSPLR